MVRVIPALSEHHEVVALDLPGCGRSDKPETDYSIGAQAAFAVGIGHRHKLRSEIGIGRRYGEGAS